MKMKRRALSLFLAIAMFAGLTACTPSTPSASAPTPSQTPPASQGTPMPSPPAPSGDSDIIDGEKMDLIFASHLNPGSPENIAMQWILDELSEKTRGNIKGTLHEGGVLGTESETTEQVVAGSLHLNHGSFTSISQYAKEFGSFAATYLYPNENSVLKSWAGPIGEAIREKYRAAGFDASRPLFRGNRHLTSNKLVTTPEDLKGLKIRLPDNEADLIIWGAMGALPVPIASAEVFSALQMGVVEAQENPISSNFSKGIWEVQKYTVLTNHMVAWVAFQYPMGWYNSLSDPYKKLFTETLDKGAEYGSDLNLELEGEYRKQMEDEGMEFIDVDISLFLEAAAPGVEKVASNWADWVYDQALEDIAAAS